LLQLTRARAIQIDLNKKNTSSSFTKCFKITFAKAYKITVNFYQKQINFSLIIARASDMGNFKKG